MLNVDMIYTISLWLLPVLIAITFHEAAHAFVARSLGDDTASRLGRVSLDADAGIIRQQQADSYPVAATFGLTSQQRQYFERYTEPNRGSVFGRAVLEGRKIHVPDVLADSEHDRPGQQEFASVRALLGVPLTRDGAVVGVFTLHRQEPKPFSQKQIELVTTFADQAVIAIENVRLFDEIQDKSRQLAEASKHKSQFLANMSHVLFGVGSQRRSAR